MKHLKNITTIIFLVIFFTTMSGFSKLNDIEKNLANKNITNASSQTGTVYRTGGIGLNFRTSPWGSIQGALNDGDNVTVINKSGDWYEVKSGNKTGFVHGNYLNVSSTTQSTASTPQTVSATKYVNVSSYLNVRSGPWGTKLGRLNSGDKVEIVGNSGDWVEIKYNGQTAFVHGDYLSATEPTSGNTNTATTAPPAGNVTGSAAARAIVSEAHNQLGTTRYRTAILDYGNLACAAFVSGVLKNSGTITGNGSINTVGLKNVVVQQGWTRVSLSNIQPGDVIFWGPYPGGRHGHVGVIDSKQGGTWYSIDNSSSQRTPIRHTLNTRRPIVGVYRAPGA